MKYRVEQNAKYDFAGQSYGGMGFPNMHKYPATMIPQVGIEVLRELGVTSGQMLDPYCGSGSSFASGLACGMRCFVGCDINPLAIEICKAKLTRLDVKAFVEVVHGLRADAYAMRGRGMESVAVERFENFSYWFGDRIAAELQMLKNLADAVADVAMRRLLLLALSAAMRDCSYVRNNEFKLYRMKADSLPAFNPDVLGVFFSHVNKVLHTYAGYYHQYLAEVSARIVNLPYGRECGRAFDVVLTSPPYGDSKTTVAYGQFSLFSNRWVFGMEDARKLDAYLMGGRAQKRAPLGSLIDAQIGRIAEAHAKRAEEVAAFYGDLAESIGDVAQAVAPRGYVVYVVGNRTVKGVNLRTDQFIAEQFEKNGLRHCVTFERAIGHKRMPKWNSPSNRAGEKGMTINREFIVICQG